MGAGITEPQGGLRGTGREEPHSESGGTRGERKNAQVVRGCGGVAGVGTNGTGYRRVAGGLFRRGGKSSGLNDPIITLWHHSQQI
jgi:hypothetical protein